MVIIYLKGLKKISSDKLILIILTCFLFFARLGLIKMNSLRATIGQLNGLRDRRKH